MVTYADTSVIVPLYVPEQLSTEAQVAVTALSQPLPFNQLHELETRNAIRRKVPTGQASVAQTRRYLANLERDIEDGIWVQVPTDWEKAFREAERLSVRFTKKANARSFDILHVALAMVGGFTHFITCDAQQAGLVSKTKLSCALVRTPQNQV